MIYYSKILFSGYSFIKSMNKLEILTNNIVCMFVKILFGLYTEDKE